MRGICRVHTVPPSANDDPATFACLLVTGPQGGYRGDVNLTRAGVRQLRDKLDVLLVEDSVRRLRKQADELGIGRCPCGSRAADSCRPGKPDCGEIGGSA